MQAPRMHRAGTHRPRPRRSQRSTLGQRVPKCSSTPPPRVLRKVMSVPVAGVKTLDNATHQAERFRGLAPEQAVS
jgi:hypothetical protein